MAPAAAAVSPQFQIVGRLGGGGMADVYLAQMLQEGSCETVALKRIRHELGKDDQYTLQFEREARICRLLDHENIVALRASGVDEVGLFMALEYVEGYPASALIRGLHGRAACPIAALTSIGRDIVEGLRYAHLRRDNVLGVSGVIHRDISPGNVLIGYSGVAKLADFGIAKTLGATRFTATGTLKGKIGYIAPELYDGADATTASDVFALGATLFFLACGAPAFDGRTEGELLRAVLHASPVQPRILRPELPPGLEAWLMGSLEKDPQRRPPLEALRAELGGDDGGGRTAVAALMREILPAGARVEPVARTPDLTVIRATRSVIARLGPKRSATTLVGLLAVAGTASVGTALLLRRPNPLLTAPAHAPEPVKLPRPPEAPASQPGPAPAPAPRTVATVATAPEPASKPARRERPTTIWVKVQPWARIFVDGELKGLTPKRPFPVSPGPHTVRVVNDELKTSKTLQVLAAEHRQTEVKVVLEPAP